jgi:ATP-binding cassette subfamily B protein
VVVDALTRSAAEPAARHDALWAFGSIVALGLLSMILRLSGLRAIIPFTLRIMSDVARDTFMRVQRFSTDWHANSFAGSTVRKITRGMWALDLLNDTILMALLPSLMVLVGSMILLGLHWASLGLVVALGAAIYVSMTVWFSTRYIAPAARVSNAWDTKVGGTLADALTCNAVVKSFGAEAREDERLAGVVNRWRTRVRRTWLRYTNTSTAQLAALLCLRVSVIGGSLLLWMSHRLATSPIGTCRYLRRAIRHRRCGRCASHRDYGRADRVRGRDVPLRRTSHTAVRRPVGGHQGRRTRRPCRPLRLRQTTFVKLVQWLYDVSGGRILIDGQDIAKATQLSLRSRIAIVQHDPVLFHRSLADNIAYGRPGASMAAIEQAARLANAHEFITRLAKAYGTLVGERGVKLSGGERQRVALARAFLADAPVLILDEATSSLDSESEALIQQAMERLMKGRTSIVIAHRLSTVRSLDRILVFDRGEIVEEGNHAALIARGGGIYRGLFERQAMEFAYISAAE